MHKFTQAGLERIVDKLGTAVKLLKREKKDAEQASQKFELDYAITLFEESHLKFYKKELAKLKRWELDSEKAEEVLAREAVETVLSPLNADEHISKAAKILARYIVNPSDDKQRKKLPNYVGLERLTLVVAGSKNKNIFEAWEKEWAIKNFYDNELGVKKQFRCAACGNQASKNVTLTNKETGSEISFNYQCFDNLTADLGVKLGGTISALKHAKTEAADALAKQFNELLAGALEKTGLAEAATEINQELPEEYRIVADEEALLKHLSSMYKYFEHEPDFTAGTKEFEPRTNLRTWSRLRFEDESVPSKVRAAHEKFLSLSKMKTAEMLVFIQDYKLNRAVSILENKDVLDDLFLLELREEINLDPIRHLLKSRVTPAVGDKITEFGAQHRQKRIAHNQALIEKYGEETISGTLKRALVHYFQDREDWHEARKRLEEEPEATLLSKEDYSVLTKICERLTLGFPKDTPPDFAVQEAKAILLNQTPMLTAQRIFRELAVIQRKLKYGTAQGNETSKLKGAYIPAEEFHNFTDIDRRFSLETVIDKIEYSFARTKQHAEFVQAQLPGLKQSLEHGLISRELTYHKDSAYELSLSEEQADALASLGKEIKSLNERIKKIHVPQKPGPEKTKLTRKRDELETQKDELIIRRYLVLKGDYKQYALRDTQKNRITQGGKALSCTLKEIFDGVKEFRPIKEFGDLSDKIDEIADLLEAAPIFLHIPHLSPNYTDPAVLRSLKYIDDAGVAIIARVHGMLTKPSLDLAESLKAARDTNAKELLAQLDEAAGKGCRLLDGRGELAEIGLKQQHRAERRGGEIQYYKFKAITHDFKTVEGSVPFPELLANQSIAAALKSADEKTYALLTKTNPGAAGLLQKAAELASSQDTSTILVPNNIKEWVEEITGNLPWYETQARRQDAAEGKSGQEIRTAFVQKIYERIQAQPEREKEAYWRLINGQKMYFSRKEGDKGWKENPRYNLSVPDEKYWQDDLTRFLDSTTTGEMRGYLQRPRWKKRGNWINWDYRYLASVARGEIHYTKWRYRNDIEEKLKRHSQEKHITESQAEKFFIPVARRLEGLVNQVLSEWA